MSGYQVAAAAFLKPVWRAHEPPFALGEGVIPRPARSSESITTSGRETHY